MKKPELSEQKVTHWGAISNGSYFLVFKEGEGAVAEEFIKELIRLRAFESNIKEGLPSEKDIADILTGCTAFAPTDATSRARVLIKQAKAIHKLIQKGVTDEKA